jgi:hypothetical protein
MTKAPPLILRQRALRFLTATAQGGHFIGTSLTAPGLRLLFIGGSRRVIASAAKQSTAQTALSGLLRRCAPRNDGFAAHSGLPNPPDVRPVYRECPASCLDISQRPVGPLRAFGFCLYGGPGASLRALRSNPLRGLPPLDCFGAAPLAMTASPHIRGSQAPRMCVLFTATAQRPEGSFYRDESDRSVSSALVYMEGPGPSLRAQRSNPPRRLPSLDCFGAAPLAMTASLRSPQ